VSAENHFPFEFMPELMCAPGELIIEEANLTFLEEKLEELEQRAKYYDDYPFGKPNFLEMVESLKQIAKAIRRSAK
jgi:hypothetical protein